MGGEGEGENNMPGWFHYAYHHRGRELASFWTMMYWMDCVKLCSTIFTIKTVIGLLDFDLMSSFDVFGWHLVGVKYNSTIKNKHLFIHTRRFFLLSIETLCVSAFSIFTVISNDPCESCSCLSWPRMIWIADWNLRSHHFITCIQSECLHYLSVDTTNLINYIRYKILHYVF